MEKWDGLVCVVTGASSGIGKAIALTLAQHGMKVAALARREDMLKETAASFKGKGEIRPYKCDVAEESSVCKTFVQVEKDMGPIRVLVNNAGVAPIFKFMDFEIDTWRKIFNVNLFGMFTCVKYLMQSIKQRKSDHLVHIINVNSIAGHQPPSNINFAVYSSSKHCVTLLTHGLMKQLAQEKLNIRVTSLSPGVVESEMTSQVSKDLFDIEKFPHLKADDIAEAAVAALSSPESVIISELTVKPKGEVL